MTQAHNPVGWFEIPVTDMDRAKSFYQAMLGCTFDDLPMGQVEMALFPMQQDAIGSSGALVKGAGYAPSAEGLLIYFTAPDLDNVIQRCRDNGGTVVQNRTSIGEHGFIAYIQDTEGNRIGLHTNH